MHTTAYSYIAIQEMSLVTNYNPLYWYSACLSVNASAIAEEDYFNLIEQNIISLVDEEDKRKMNKIQYGKVASAIDELKLTVKIELPDINKAKFGFSPNISHNSIMFGLKGISKIGDELISEIIKHRPFTSVEDFVTKMVRDGKKLISKDKVVNLIKAGCFDNIEQKTRRQNLEYFIMGVADLKQKLTLQNVNKLVTLDLFPDSLQKEKEVFLLNKYFKKHKISTYYYLEPEIYDHFINNYNSNFLSQIIVEGCNYIVIAQKQWDAYYKEKMLAVKSWINTNMESLLNQINQIEYSSEFDKYAAGDELQWELDSLNFFYSGHPLSNKTIPATVTSLSEVEEEKLDGYWGKEQKIPKYRLYKIIGTVLSKNKAKGLVSFATPEGTIDVKCYKDMFAHYDKTVEDDYGDIEPSFFEKGTHLIITGIKRNDVFVPKVYKSTGHDAILKIVLENDEFKHFLRKSQ